MDELATPVLLEKMGELSHKLRKMNTVILQNRGNIHGFDYKAPIGLNNEVIAFFDSFKEYVESNNEA